jgi:anti-anti-sigma factor
MEVMEITKSQNADKIVLALNGRLDSISAPQLQEVLISAVGESKLVELDFTKLVYISSAGLRTLLLGEKNSKANGCEMVLLNVSQEIKEIFEMTRFTDILKIQN